MRTTTKTKPKLIPERQIPQELADKGLVKPAGGRCRACGWTTPKKGFNGRQAMRAHLKKHKRERRAWQVPLILQLLVVAALLGLAITGWMGVTLPVDLPFSTPVVTFPATITTWATLGTGITLLLISPLFLFSGPVKGGRVLGRILGFLIGVGSLTGLWTVALALEFVGPPLFWPFYVPLVALAVLTPAMAVKAGQVRLLVKRRGVRSEHYTIMVEPKNAKARYAIQKWWDSRRKPKRQAGKVELACPGCKVPLAEDTGPGTRRCTNCGAFLRIRASTTGSGLVVRRINAT